MGCGGTQMNDPIGAAAQQSTASTLPPADQQTQQMMANYQAMKKQGIFNTPYQNAQRNHPLLMGLGNMAMAAGQGLNKQPYYTANQENQIGLQNTQLQGMNNMVAMPAQMRMQMMLLHPELAQGTNPVAPTNVPGIPSAAPVAPISSPQAMARPAPAQPGASFIFNGVPMVKDAQGNWNPQGQK